MNWCWIGLHKWDKWKTHMEFGTTYGNIFYKVPEGVEYSEEHQRRTCQSCGKVEDEAI